MKKVMLLPNEKILIELKGVPIEMRGWPPWIKKEEVYGDFMIADVNITNMRLIVHPVKWQWHYGRYYNFKSEKKRHSKGFRGSISHCEIGKHRRKGDFIMFKTKIFFFPFYLFIYTKQNKIIKKIISL